MAQVVASSLLASVLTRRSEQLEILGASSGLVWLALDGRALTLQRSPTNSKLALPTSIFLQAGDTLLAKAVSLDDGRLSLGGSPIEINRWWQPPRAPIVSWVGAFTPAPAIGPLLGLGDGLTPEGDDLLAGWLVAARSIGHPEFELVRSEIGKNSTMRTTTFSAALLDCAGEGYGVAPLIDYLKVCLQDSTDDLDILGARAGARAELSEVGHTSGEALANGVDTALGLGVDKIHFSKFNLQERASA